MEKHPHIADIIDTAAIWGRVERLCALIPILLARPSVRGLRANSLRMKQAVRALIRASLSNQRRELKLAMLSHGPWRGRVLRELGGEKALALWAARWAGYESSCLRKNERCHDATLKDRKDVWRKTPERAAEEERQKAHARKCARACAHPRIIHDPFKVDGDGLFRLAPVPRLTAPRRDSACIPFDIMEYNFTGEPVANLTGANAPIMLWPREFEIAAELEGEIIMERELAVKAPSPVIPRKERSDADAGADRKRSSMRLGPAFAGFALLRDDRKEIADSYDGPD